MIRGSGNGDDIKPTGCINLSILLQVYLCGSANTLLFLVAHGFGSRSESIRFTQPDFHKNDFIGIPGNQVNFTRPGSEVAMENL